jgi:glyoxylase-like metal-dependent hydrolase (beta-lactamase superfamily II)
MSRDVSPLDAEPCEIAPDVYWLPVGRGILMGSNVYFARSGSSWSLVDAGWARDAPAIRKAAGTLFGWDARPAAILLTHDHPDHAGAAVELARQWDCPVLVHPEELPLALGDVEAIRRYAGPLDRWVILPGLRLLGRRKMAATLARSSLGGAVATLDRSGAVPGLPGWEVIHTPGHTPGHVAFLRREDGVIISGDALLTIDLNSCRGIVRREQKLSGSPWYTTWSWPAASASAAALASLAPRVVAGGHGVPMTGAATSRGLRRFSTAA